MPQPGGKTDEPVFTVGSGEHRATRSSLSRCPIPVIGVFGGNVPIAFAWNGSEIVICTAKNAPKLPSLRRNPAVALTIDTEVHPPKILLIRGRAKLDVVDGIPDEYLQINGSYEMTPEQRVEWEAGVRSLYHGMVRIVVTPTWAKLIDFHTTLPSAVEELIQQRDERQRA